MTSVPFPPRFLDSIVWLPDGRLAFGSLIDSSREIWSVFPDGHAAGPLDVDPGMRCTRTELFPDGVLADGRLAYQIRCFPGPRGPFTYRTGLMALDTAGHSTTLMPLTDLPFIPRQAAWAPDLSQGLLGGGSVICEGIVRVDGSGMHPWNLSLGSGDGRFNLADFLAATDDCGTTGNVDTPAWSPDGKTVAFFGATAAVGHSGQSRLDDPWALYTVDGNLAAPRIVLDGLVDPGDASWSPDGRWLALKASVGGAKGLWLLEFPTRRLLRISDHDGWVGVAWSPDGSHLAGLRDDTPLGAPRVASIVVLDVSALVAAH